MADSEEVKDEVVFTSGHKYHRGCSALVKFTALDGKKLDSNDYIGLYLVGWTTIRDYSTYQYVRVPEVLPEGAVDLMLEFPASTLPKNDNGEFYQFVYVRVKTVVGTSLPFQFISPRTQVFVQKDEGGEDSDLVLVQTEEEALQEKMDHQTEQVVEMKAQLQRKSDLVSSQSDVLAIQEEMTRQLEDKVNRKTQDFEDAVKHAESLKEDLEHTKRKLTKSRDRAHVLDDEKGILTGRCASLEHSLSEALTQQNHTQLELTKCTADLAAAVIDNKSVGGERSKLEQEVESVKRRLKKMASDNEVLAQQLFRLAQDNSTLRGEVEEANRRAEDISERMTNQLTAQGEAKEMVKEELKKEKDEHRRSLTEIKGLKEQVAQLQDREKEYKSAMRSWKSALTKKEDENSDQQHEIRQLTETAEQDAALLQSDLEATQRTLEATKNEVATLKAKESALVLAAKEEAVNAREELESVRRLAAVKGLEATAMRQELELALAEREESRAQGQTQPEVAELQKQLQDLKRRLKAGEKAYTQVFKEKEKQGKRFKEMRRTISTMRSMEGRRAPKHAHCLQSSDQPFPTMYGNPYEEDIKRIHSGGVIVPTKQPSNPQN